MSFSSVPFFLSPEADLEERLVLQAPVPSSLEAAPENSPQTHPLACGWGGWALSGKGM